MLEARLDEASIYIDPGDVGALFVVSVELDVLTIEVDVLRELLVLSELVLFQHLFPVTFVVGIQIMLVVEIFLSLIHVLQVAIEGLE